MRVVSDVITTEGVLLKQGFLGTYLLKNGMARKREELQALVECDIHDVPLG